MTELAHDAPFRALPVETDAALAARGARIAERLNRARDGEPIAVSFVAAGERAYAAGARRVHAGRELLAMSDALVAFVVAREMAHHDLGHRVGRDADRTLEQEIAADRAALELLRRAGFAESGAHDAFALFALVHRDHVALAARRRALWGVAVPAPTALAPRGFASTNATVVCASCVVRFAPRRACPRCGRLELHALSAAAARRAFLEARRWRGTSFGVLVALASLALAAMWIPGAPLAALGLLALALWEGALVVSLLTRRVPVRPARPQLTRAAAEITVRGTVRTVRPALSPLGARGAAWRLRGRAPGGEIDDAGVGRFELTDGDAVVARVEADDAVVDLGPAGPRVEHRVEGALATFLAERGGPPDAARARLAETVLRDGDRVEVSGVADEVVVAVGYRDATPVLVFRDWPAIRRI